MGLCLSAQSQNDYNAVDEMESLFMWPSLNKALYCESTGGGSPRQSGLVIWASEEESVYAVQGRGHGIMLKTEITPLKEDEPGPCSI